MTLSEHQRHASQSRWAKPNARADQSARLKEVWALAKAAKKRARTEARKHFIGGPK
jgi:hypothetical protein